MTVLADVRVIWHGETPVAAVHGEVDASNIGQIATALRNAVTNHSTELVVDLTSTRYLDSAGINLLFAFGEEMRGRQLVLRLVVSPKSPISRMLAITSLDKAQPTYPDVASALSG